MNILLERTDMFFGAVGLADFDLKRYTITPPEFCKVVLMDVVRILSVRI